jgi:hypothetical protein
LAVPIDRTNAVRPATKFLYIEQSFFDTLAIWTLFTHDDTRTHTSQPKAISPVSGEQGVIGILIQTLSRDARHCGHDNTQRIEKIGRAGRGIPARA